MLLSIQLAFEITTWKHLFIPPGVFKMSLGASDIPLSIQPERPDDPDVHGTSRCPPRSYQQISAASFLICSPLNYRASEASARRLHDTELGGGAGC